MKPKSFSTLESSLRQTIETLQQLSNSSEPLTLSERPPQSRIAVLCLHNVSLCRAVDLPLPQWGYPTIRKQNSHIYQSRFQILLPIILKNITWPKWVNFKELYFCYFRLGVIYTDITNKGNSVLLILLPAS